MVCPKWVRHRTSKNHQPGVSDADRGYFEYPAIVTNKKMPGGGYGSSCAERRHFASRHHSIAAVSIRLCSGSSW